MEQQDYKNEIRSSRCGALGSSDGKLILQVAESGVIPKSAYKRLAVCKGLIEQEDIPYTDAVRAGDELEMLVFEHLKANDDRYQSNPCWVSEKYSRKNVKLLTHPDIVLQDDENKVLNVYEVKCTKFTFEQTRNTYKAQLIIHWLIANEIAKGLGGYKVRLYLVHYSTDGMNLEDGFEFDPSRLTVKQLRNMEKESCRYKLADAMDIVSSFLESFDSYYEGDEIDSVHLPEKVKQEFDTITTILSEIKEREAKVEEFKTRLYDFMLSHDIKSIKSETWGITRVDASESRSFDYKVFLSDYATKHPRLYNKLVKAYEKVVKRKGNVQIRIKK
jgi:hypothetical protein